VKQEGKFIDEKWCGRMSKKREFFAIDFYGQEEKKG